MSTATYRDGAHFLPADIARLPALWPPDYETDPSSLEPPETNVPVAHTDTPWGTSIESSDPPVLFRHSGWARIRTKVRAALETNHASPRQLSRFDLCGGDPWVAVDPEDPTRFTLLANHCHSRWCLPCARERGRTIATNLQLKLGDEPTRFLTLTLRSNDGPLRTQLDRLYSAFRRLRSRSIWKRCVTGGAAVLEVKHGWKSARWHAHLHVLFHGSFIAQRVLAALWWKITGDSYIIDIRLLPDSKAAAAYVCKYISKPLSSTIVNKPDALSEFIATCSGRRLVLTFGSWRGCKLTEKIDATEWKSICPLTTLYERFEAGDSDAALIVEALEASNPEAPILAGRAPPTHAQPDRNS